MTPFQSRPKLETLVEILRWYAEHHGDRRLYTFIEDGEETSAYSFAEADRAARRIAARLQQTLEFGDRALLMYPPGPAFAEAFFGCLYAGVIAVPVVPPGLRDGQERIATILRIAENCGAKALLVDRVIGKAVEGFRESLEPLARMEVLVTDQVEARREGSPRCQSAGLEASPRAKDTGFDAASSSRDTGLEAAPVLRDTGLESKYKEYNPCPDQVAFLQYTSGTTGQPKGVRVTHGNAVANQRCLREIFTQDSDMVGVGWLPQFHDMGLIGNLFYPAFLGSQMVLMSPIEFLRHPRRWLEAITKYRATISGGPNFAYELCMRRVPPEAREGLDLSSWEIAFDGAEPVRSSTVRRFCEGFGPVGFRRGAFTPCYGLAEGTLIVTGSYLLEEPVFRTISRDDLFKGIAQPLASDAETVELCSSGRPASSTQVRIVSPMTGEEQPAGVVGEIWEKGPCVTAGYWGMADDEVRATFSARETTSGEEGYLRTGDLGFVLDGELFVTGRIKDLLIFAGRNHYPQDIEATVERLDSRIRPGCCAAFSIDKDWEERLIVVAETRGWGQTPTIDLFDQARKGPDSASDSSVRGGQTPTIDLSSRDPKGPPTSTTQGEGTQAPPTSTTQGEGTHAPPTSTTQGEGTHASPGSAPQSEDAQASTLDELKNKIRRAIVQAHEIRAQDVLLLQPRTLPKTSSGKLQRRLIREMYLNGALESRRATEA